MSYGLFRIRAGLRSDFPLGAMANVLVLSIDREAAKFSGPAALPAPCPWKGCGNVSLV